MPLKENDGPPADNALRAIETTGGGDSIYSNAPTTRPGQPLCEHGKKGCGCRLGKTKIGRRNARRK